MIRIATANVNGIRSAATKGFFDWFLRSNIDVLCLQELKAQTEQLSDAVFSPEGYQRYLFSAERPGYSGVAIYTRLPVKKVTTGLGFEQADREGRYVEADFGAFRVASLYLPSGSSGPERQLAKDEFLQLYLPILKKQSKQKTPLVICGDFNIAHKEIDIKNWKGNLKNSGFLPHERQWLTQLFDDLGFVDAFRVVDNRAEQYTWWSNRGQAYAKNVGWRIDYHIVSASLRETIHSASIFKDIKFSDHAPLIMDYNLSL